MTFGRYMNLMYSRRTSRRKYYYVVSRFFPSGRARAGAVLSTWRTTPPRNTRNESAGGVINCVDYFDTYWAANQYRNETNLPSNYTKK